MVGWYFREQLLRKGSCGLEWAEMRVDRLLAPGRHKIDLIAFEHLRQRSFTELSALHSHARHQPAGWIQAQRPFNDLAGIGELRQLVQYT